MRAGIRNVIVPKSNEKDLPEIPAEMKKYHKFTFADTVDEVLAAALEGQHDRARASMRLHLKPRVSAKGKALHKPLIAG